MGFKRYIHLERLGSQEVDGIELGVCHVFPKLDGTNASIWYNPEKKFIEFGSRSRVLEEGRDNHGFRNTMLQYTDETKRLFEIFEAHPEWNIYGEWLVPHTLRSYRESAWRKFWVFDVLDASDTFLSYEDYFGELAGLNVINPICIIENPSQEQLLKVMQHKNTFLVDDGKGIGEGIVIKRYGFKNKYDRTVWAKLVNNEFKEMNAREFFKGKVQPGEFQVEAAIVQDFVTETLVQKTLAKIKTDMTDRGQIIPRLLNTVYYELIKEECWEFVKKYNRPTINFATLYKYCVQRTKEHAKELF